MKSPPSTKFERGAVAVELAFTLIIFVIMLLATLAVGRLFWHYTVTHKAAQDAARYLSTISVQEMRERDLARAAANLAQDIARREVADLNPGSRAPEIQVFCGNANCTGIGGLSPPRTVKVIVRLEFQDVFGFFDFGRYGLPIEAVAEMRYAGT